jgi:hypothetical protein
MFSSFSRRQLLNLVGFVVTGTVIAGSAPFIGNFFASKAQAQETEEFVYKGRKYRIGSQQLFLDNKEINVVQDKNTQKYLTPLLFAQFDSLHEVARTLIDQGIKFPSGKVKVDPNVD